MIAFNPHVRPALLAAAAACVFVGPAMAAGSVDLRPKFVAGQTHTFTQQSIRVETTSIAISPPPAKEGEKKDAPATPPGPASSTQNIDQTVTYKVEVIETNAKGTSLALEILAIKANAETPRGKFTFDSSSPADDKDGTNPAVQAYRPLIGGKLRIDLGSDGNVTKVEPMSLQTPRISPEFTGAVQQIIGPDLVRMRWSTVLNVKDGADPAAIGQTWTNVDELVSRPIGKFTYSTDNKLTKIDGDTAHIDMSGSIKLAGFDDKTPAAGSITKQSVTGNVIWDTKSGWAKSHTIQQTWTIEVNPTGMPVTRAIDLKVVSVRLD